MFTKTRKIRPRLPQAKKTTVQKVADEVSQVKGQYTSIPSAIRAVLRNYPRECRSQWYMSEVARELGKRKKRKVAIPSSEKNRLRRQIAEAEKMSLERGDHFLPDL